MTFQLLRDLSRFVVRLSEGYSEDEYQNTRYFEISPIHAEAILRYAEKLGLDVVVVTDERAGEGWFDYHFQVPQDQIQPARAAEYEQMLPVALANYIRLERGEGGKEVRSIGMTYGADSVALPLVWRWNFILSDWFNDAFDPTIIYEEADNPRAMREFASQMLSYNAESATGLAVTGGEEVFRFPPHGEIALSPLEIVDGASLTRSVNEIIALGFSHTFLEMREGSDDEIIFVWSAERGAFLPYLTTDEHPEPVPVGGGAQFSALHVGFDPYRDNVARYFTLTARPTAPIGVASADGDNPLIRTEIQTAQAMTRFVARNAVSSHDIDRLRSTGAILRSWTLPAIKARELLKMAERGGLSIFETKEALGLPRNFPTDFYAIRIPGFPHFPYEPTSSNSPIEISISEREGKANYMSVAWTWPLSWRWSEAMARFDFSLSNLELTVENDYWGAGADHAYNQAELAALAQSYERGSNGEHLYHFPGYGDILISPLSSWGPADYYYTVTARLAGAAILSTLSRAPKRGARPPMAYLSTTTQQNGETLSATLKFSPIMILGSLAWSAVSFVAAGASAYHGYKRNDSLPWAIAWGILGSAVPVITVPVALAQGFAQRKRNGSRRRRR